MKLISLTVLMLSVFLTCCQFINIFDPGNGDSNTLKSVIITDTPPDSIQWDSFSLNSAKAIVDTLKLNVSYGGGCENHTFQLFMSPSVFMESNPVQVNIYLRHNANGDACKALINQDLSFNIKPISDAYRQGYHSRAGTVILNIFEYFESKPGKTLQVNYSFL